MPPSIHPVATPAHGGSQLQFVPVSGAVVFFVCVLLIVACLVWLGLLLHQGVEHDKEA